MRDSYKILTKPSEGTYSELRSKFLAFAIPVRTAEEAMEQVAKYQKEYFDARHVCWAYRLGPEGEEYRSNDNGEPSGTAGKPILGQMVSADVSDLIILVIRYFGGVKLGTSGLIVAYRTAAAEAIAAATIEERQVEATYDFSFEYPLMTAVMKVVRDMNARILEQSYDMDCRMSVSIRKGLLDELKTRVQKAISPF